MKNLSLANLVLTAQEAEFEFPLCKGMVVTVAYANSTLLNTIREKSLVQKFDPETGTPFQELDGEKYVLNYAKAVIKGWKGFTYAHLASMVLIDETGVDLEKEIPFDLDSAAFLMNNATTFDTWVVTSAKKLSNFRK